MILRGRRFGQYLVVLYSINGFITFFLSQPGWCATGGTVAGERGPLGEEALHKRVGMTLTVFHSLISVTVLKFHEEVWITILLDGIAGRHGSPDEEALPGILTHCCTGLDELVTVAESSCPIDPEATRTEAGADREVYDPKEKDAVLLVSGFNGLGLHTLFGVHRLVGRDLSRNVRVHLPVGRQ